MAGGSKISEKDSLATENRREQRYPCLGIGLLYSLNMKANMENVGADIYRAQIYDMSLCGLSIDVHEHYEAGEKIRLCIEAPLGQREILVAEVKWCKSMEDVSYRLGLTIQNYSGTAESCEKSSAKGCYSHQKQAVPSEIRLHCPSCEEHAQFEYLGEQAGIPDNGVLSLYNCSACGTTRSITTILQYNRKR